MGYPQTTKKDDLKFNCICAAILLSFVGSVIGLLVYASNLPFTIEEGRFINIVRVLMHETNNFTLIQQNGIELKELQFRRCKSVQMLQDVPLGDPMWASYKLTYKNDRAYGELELTLHLHSAEDINGAGWNHGKFGRGQTVVVK